MDRHIFQDPGTAYRGVALWMLNDELEPDEIARQLAGMSQAGWGAVITRTFFGLRTQYLSDEWMQVLERIVTLGAEHDLKVWFQAGHMPSAIPGLDPEMALHVLSRVEVGADVEGHGPEPLEGQRPEPPEGQRPEPPEGQVLAEDEVYAYVERAQPHVLDLLSPQAVEFYLKKAYEETWVSRFGRAFGATIESIWVDEPHFRPPLLPWSLALPARFATQWGYAIVDHLPELFAPVGDYKKVRHDYWRVIVEMFLEGYFEPVGKWCTQHGVRFSGHLMGEDTLNNQVAWTGAAMPCYEYMQLPGIDHLTNSTRWPTGKKFILTPKQCSSAANQMGTDWILAEMYGVSSQGITFEDQKRIASWLAVLGINYRCYHGYFYSLRGRRKRYYPPHLSHQQPWWPESKRIADYFARLSYALRQGTYRADVLVLHPVESAFCLFDTLALSRPHDRTLEPEDVKALDSKLVNLCDNLLSIQRGFEFGDETLLAKHGAVVEGGLQVGQMIYKSVVLPEMITIRASTLELLKAFAAAGGQILAAGELPERVDGRADGRAGELASIVEQVANECEALRAALASKNTPDLELVPAAGSDPSSVWVHERAIEGGKLVYLTNTSTQAGVRAELRLRGTGRLERWDLVRGEVAVPPQTPLGDVTTAEIALAPLGSELLVLRKGEQPVTVPEISERLAREVPVLREASVARHDPNALTLDTCRYKKGDEPWREALPVLTVYELLAREEYEGPLSVQFSFEVETVPETLRLVVEDAAQYEITVNGHRAEYQRAEYQRAAYAGRDYWIDGCFDPIDVVGLVKEGANTVELSIRFKPVPQAKFSLSRLFEKLEGVELESIYLIGDFAVSGARSPRAPQPRCVRFAPEFRISAERGTTSGDLVSEGYPFYAGRMSLTETVSLQQPAEGERVVLAFPSIDAAALAIVRVNGVEAGALMWAPYEVDVTSLVVEGDNQIEVELVGTLRNLLGPHHRPVGEDWQCWGTDYTLYPQWLEDEGTLSERWTDDYFFLSFGLRGGVVRYLEQ